MTGHWQAELLREQLNEAILKIASLEEDLRIARQARDTWERRYWSAAHLRLGGSGAVPTDLPMPTY